jgi:hypothetical protein
MQHLRPVPGSYISVTTALMSASVWGQQATPPAALAVAPPSLSSSLGVIVFREALDVPLPGHGQVSSRSLMSKTSRRSGVA